MDKPGCDVDKPGSEMDKPGCAMDQPSCDVEQPSSEVEGSDLVKPDSGVDKQADKVVKEACEPNRIFSIKVWELFSMKFLGNFSKHQNPITAISAHPSFAYVVSGDEMGNIFLWDPENHIENPLISSEVKNDPPESTDNAPEGRDTLEGKDLLKHELVYRGESPVMSISIISCTKVNSNAPKTQTKELVDSKQSIAIIVATKDKQVLVFDATLTCHWKFKTNHTDMLLSITVLLVKNCVDVENHKVDACGEINSINNMSDILQPSQKNNETIVAKQPSSDGADPIIHCEDNPLRDSNKKSNHDKIIPVEIINQEAAQQFMQEFDWFQSVMIITGSWDKSVRCWRCNFNEKEKNLKSTILWGHRKSVTAITSCFVFGPRNDDESHRPMPIIVSASLDKTCIVWDAEKFKMIRVLSGHQEKITTINVVGTLDPLIGNKSNYRQRLSSPPLLLTGSEDKLVVIWDILTGIALRRFQHQSSVLTLDSVLLSERLIIASGDSSDGTKGKEPLHVWNLLGNMRHHVCDTEADVISFDIICKFPQSEHLSSNPSKEEFNGTIVVGTVDGYCREFDLISKSPKEKFSVCTPHTHTRVNAVLFYQPPPVEQDDKTLNFKSPWLIISEGEAKLSIWNFDTKEQLKTLIGHGKALFAMCVYEPHKLGKNVLANSNHTDTNIDLNRTLLITGGIDEQLCVWDVFDDVPSSIPFPVSCKPLRSIKKAHSKPIRSIAIHYNQTNGSCQFVTGSYDKTSILWDLQTMERLRIFQKVHSGFVFAVAIYDPVYHCGLEGNMKRSEGKLQKEPMLITGGYDGILAFYNLFIDGKDLTGKQEAVCTRKVLAHNESITAMTLYTPRLAKDDPLVITGSIDTKVIVWNIFTGERMQTLIGHSNRVCFMSVLTLPTDPYQPDNPEDKGRPLLITGGDDHSIIIWEDALHQRKFMPTSDAVQSAFLSDLKMSDIVTDAGINGKIFDQDHPPNVRDQFLSSLEHQDWHLITHLAKTYKHQLFIENPTLFSMAIAEGKPDFLLKFQTYLSYMIRFLPDLLKEAINKYDLASVRVILLCWLENCNRDIDNRLEQRLFHASYFLPTEHLHNLAEMYPLEFIKFISGLKLIRNHCSLIQDNHSRQKLNIVDRIDIVGMKDPSSEYVSTWQKVFEGRPKWLDNLNEIREVILYERCSKAHPVASLMIPLKNAATIEMLECFVEVSDLLDNVEIFASPIGSTALKYYWDEHGKTLHLQEMIKYIICLIMFMFCLYSYQFYFQNVNHIIFTIGTNIIDVFMIIIFLYYLYSEITQCLVKYKRVCKKIKSQQFLKNTYNILLYCFIPDEKGGEQNDGYIRVGAFLISQFIMDIWNAIDVSIILSGITGLVMRIVANKDSPSSRIALSITSILMWFKLLYYMRPFSASGQLGK